MGETVGDEEDDERAERWQRGEGVGRQPRGARRSSSIGGGACCRGRWRQGVGWGMDGGGWEPAREKTNREATCMVREGVGGKEKGWI